MLVSLYGGCSYSFASSVKIGVASSFKQVTEHAISKVTTAKKQIKLISGASGMLVSQHAAGLAFDVLILANEKHLEQLISNTQRAPLNILTITRSQLVFWSPSPLTNNAVSQLNLWQGTVAIANPEVAPIGAASITALRKWAPKLLESGTLILTRNALLAKQYADRGLTSAAIIADVQLTTNKHKKNTIIFPDNTDLVITYHAVIYKKSATLTLLLGELEKHLGENSLLAGEY